MKLSNFMGLMRRVHDDAHEVLIRAITARMTTMDNDGWNRVQGLLLCSLQ